MEWFNYYGLIFLIVLMIPNIVYFKTQKEEKKPKIMVLEVCEQIGRFGTMIFLVFNIPSTYYGFWFTHALLIYLLVNSLLLAMYIITWIVLGKKNSLLRTLLLSLIPSVLFLFSGIMIGSIPLSICAIMFSIFHITLNYKQLGVNYE